MKKNLNVIDLKKMCSFLFAEQLYQSCNSKSCIVMEMFYFVDACVRLILSLHNIYPTYSVHFEDLFEGNLL